MSMQRLGVSFDPAAHLQAVETRRAEVEDEQIWTEGSHLEQALDGNPEVPTGRAEGTELCLPDPFLHRRGGNPALLGHVARCEVPALGSHYYDSRDNSEFSDREGSGVHGASAGLARATRNLSRATRLHGPRLR